MCMKLKVIYKGGEDVGIAGGGMRRDVHPTVGDVNVYQECMTVVELQIRTSKSSSLHVLYYTSMRK